MNLPEFLALSWNCRPAGRAGNLSITGAANVAISWRAEPQDSTDDNAQAGSSVACGCEARLTVLSNTSSGQFKFKVIGLAVQPAQHVWAWGMANDAGKTKMY